MSTIDTELARPWKFNLCPLPGEHIKWNVLEKTDWMRPMKGCLQDPQHHAEGDVLQHTKLVCESLVASDSWKQLDEEARSVLFAACLLHDVAKPATSKVDHEGKITSLKHTRIGTSMAREILWTDPVFELPRFELREQIAKMVRFSGLPMWFYEKEDPVKAVIRASMSVRLDWLAVLAEADIGGRDCSDKQDLYSRLQMFKEFCAENKCYEAPYEFASEHSKFHYFHSNSNLPERDVFDDTRTLVTIMSGLPGAGKNTWVDDNCHGLPVVSLDEIRTELDIDPEDSQGAVVAKARQKALEYLRSATDFVWNATNVTSSLRSTLILFMAPYKARFRIVYVEPPTIELLMQRNSEREDAVPERVVSKLLSKLEVPEQTEAHWVEYVVN